MENRCTLFLIPLQCRDMAIPFTYKGLSSPPHQRPNDRGSMIPKSGNRFSDKIMLN
ncbi:hypothetical protein GGQ85_000711 [Nitrobacter vulgaris]|nr:hypothetical protein [Nitrobacter vulgaris]